MNNISEQSDKGRQRVSMGKRRAAMFFANNSQSLRVVSLIASIERAACSEPARLTVEIESFNYRRMWPPGKSRLLRRYTLLTTLNSAGISANKRQVCSYVDSSEWLSFLTSVLMLKDFLCFYLEQSLFLKVNLVKSRIIKKRFVV